MTAEEWRAVLAADPRVAVWHARTEAERPPLTQEQITALRPICQRMALHMKNAAPAPTEAASHAQRTAS